MAEQQNLGREYDVQKDLDRLKEDIFRLRSDIYEMAQKLIDMGKNEAKVARGKLVEGSHQTLDRSRERGRQTVEVVGQKIEEKPLISLLTAFMLGLFLGGLGGKLGNIGSDYWTQNR